MTSQQDTFIATQRITHSIQLIRGQKVLLDRDLAAIYGVTTGRLNEAIKRNAARFPEDFMFQLTHEEAELTRSQIAILKKGRGSNLKYLPYVFTDYGAIQAANVLNSPQAIKMGIYIVRAFVQLREALASNQELAKQFKLLESHMLRKFVAHDHAITDILKTIHQLMNPPETRKRSIGFVELEERKK